MMKFRSIITLAVLSVVLTGCFDDDAKVATRNVIKAADNFEVQRRITFFHPYTNEVMFIIEGLCSQDTENNGKLAVICKTGPGSSDFKRHIISNGVLSISQQMDPITASADRYRVTIKPSTLVPTFDFR